MRPWQSALLPGLFLTSFLVAPLIAILHVAGPAMELGAWERGRLLASLQLGLLTAALALLFGAPLAYLLGKHQFRGRRALRAAVTVPFVMPVVVIAAGLSALLGPRHTGTYAALLIAHTIYNVPLVVRLVGDTWSHLDPRPEDAAATLGAGPRERFLRVTLPRLAPAIAAAALLSFLFGFTAFGTVLLLADPIKDATIEVAIYHTGMRLFDLPTAATLALLQLAVTFVAALAYALLIERASTRERAVSESETLRPLGRGNRALVVLSFLFAALLLLPLVSVVVRALRTPAGWGFEAFHRLWTGGVQNVSFTTPIAAAQHSASFALATVLLALPLGALGALAVARAKRGAWLDAVWMLPLGTSAVTLGLGLLLVFPWRFGALGAIDLRATAWLLVLAHSLIAFPFAVRALVGPLRARDPAPSEAARTLGASRTQRLALVELPLLAPALLVAGVLVASVSLGEFGATLVLLRPEYATLPAEVYKHLSASKPDGWLLPESMALATILLLLDLGAFLLLERFRSGKSGGF